MQIAAGPIGEILDAIRRAIDPWLGQPIRTIKEGRIKLIYRILSEGDPAIPMRLKIEINSREHFSVFGIQDRDFEVHSRWFTGSATVKTYQLDELLGTKLRALYQRKKGRDLFDLYTAHVRASVSPSRIIQCFQSYLEHNGNRVSRAEFEMNLQEKLSDPNFLSDIQPLLVPSADWNPTKAGEYVYRDLAPLLQGAPWKGSEP